MDQNLHEKPGGRRFLETTPKTTPATRFAAFGTLPVNGSRCPPQAPDPEGGSGVVFGDSLDDAASRLVVKKTQNIHQGTSLLR
jgi:hypothetical protein